MPSLRVPLLLLSLFLLSPPALTADARLPMPEGPVILAVSGDIRHTNVGDEAHFDYRMLTALGLHETVTHTPWTQDASRFEGPLVRRLLESVGARGSQLAVTALNDFTATVPVSDVSTYAVILAVKRDGERMPIRDFGPLFILYPFDRHPELLNETIRFRSVWQVASIHVE